MLEFNVDHSLNEASVVEGLPPPRRQAPRRQAPERRARSMAATYSEKPADGLEMVAYVAFYLSWPILLYGICKNF